MKIPLPPPDYDKLGRSVVGTGAEHLRRLLSASIGPAPGGHYLHWDELRHKTPPAGFSHADWWFAVKSARRLLYKPLPLQDKADRPFRFVLADPILSRLHRIDRDASGQIRLEAPIANSETRDTYLVSSLVEEAITSSQLEGASTTRHVAKEMLRRGRRPRDQSEQMICNNFHAMRSISERIREPLTPETILDLQRVLTQDTLDDPSAAGRLRHPHERIEVVDHRDNRVLHLPPTADELPERLALLCRFANEADGEPFVHPIIRAILLHFALAYDHPFVDGNGRVARALFYWSALSRGYRLLEFVSISRVLKQAQAQYNRSYLFTETDDSDVTYFVIHQLTVIAEAIDALQAYLGRKAEALHETESLLRSSEQLQAAFNHRQVALIRHALGHPGARYTIEGHRQSHNVVYQTARTDLLELVERGILVKRKMGRSFVFLSSPTLRDQLGN
ncbi:Fic family protein [Candidatus Thiosymbion oneisti]|uniref:Fic family protein n=1 Tax=Candidatus Thiosymbion oneisti TaxID=589554 RepID=UPI000A649A30|nr:Fic family protein [Candidatus Thiosymbion oneisti]